jgi:hypothetical protein
VYYDHSELVSLTRSLLTDNHIAIEMEGAGFGLSSDIFARNDVAIWVADSWTDFLEMCSITTAWQ